MRYIVLLAVIIFGQFSYSTTQVTHIALTLQEAAELGLFFSYEDPNKLFPALENVTITFTLETSTFTACKIEYVFFSAMDEVGNDMFAAFIGERLGKYSFRAQPEFLGKSSLSIECEAEALETDHEHYILNIGQIVQSP